MPDKVRVFGEHDERTVAQLERCVAAEDGAVGVLCADGHLGYSQPIGGVVAYRDHVSPSGVGYDIGCIAAGAPVTTADGYYKGIEDISAGEPMLGWDTERMRVVEPCNGVISRGEKPVLRLTFATRRALLLTGDHQVRTKLGWKRADDLRPGDAVAVSAFIGLPFQESAAVIDAPDPAQPSGRTFSNRAAALSARGLWPARHDDPRFPALLRVLAYCAGDGNLSPSGKRVSWYTNDIDDARDLVADVERLGFRAGLYPRAGRNGWGAEHMVICRSVELHALLAALGCPVGREVHSWPDRPFEWVFDLPAWQRAVFLSALMSAEGNRPALSTDSPWIARLEVKQAGITDAAIRFIERLFASLGFETGVTPSGHPRPDGRRAYVALLHGGEPEILRYFEEVGYNRARNKRQAAAEMLSVVAQREAAIAAPKALVHHGRYGRGVPRVPKGRRATPDSSDEVAWLPVLTIEGAGQTRLVYDVVTGDVAECFLANGVVVHNCGNKAVLTDLLVDEVQPDVPRLMNEICERISFGVGRNDGRSGDHPVIDEIRDAAFEPQRALGDLAAKQLGTVGAGNHYVDLFADEADRVWIGVHFGSRGFGHKTASGFLALAQGLPFDARASEGEMEAQPTLLETAGELGAGYIEAMRLAGRYAYAGRDVVCEEVCRILGAEPLEEVHNHHNFAWLEEHDGDAAWVVRKGATPAFPGQRGFVGATMGEPAVILEGVESASARVALYSTVHGAGRAMSRTKAAGKQRKRWACNNRDCEWVQPPGSHKPGACPACGGRSLSKRWVQAVPGLIDFAAVQAELAARGIELRGGAADEAPLAYKRLPDVLAHHAGTVAVLHELRPIGVAMAGAHTFDPYKD